MMQGECSLERHLGFMLVQSAFLSSSVQRRLPVLQVQEAVLRMHLPQLRHLELVGVEEIQHTPAGLCLDRSSLQETAKLESLALKYPGPVVTLQPDCFTGLTALASLELSACGLASIPSAVTALVDSLTSLALPCNDGLQLADDDIATLLALQKLRQLDLQKSPFGEAFEDVDTDLANAVESHLRYEPVLWSQRSFQRLVQLPGAFLAQHGHVPVLKV